MVPHMPLAGSQTASALARGETGMGLQSEMPGAKDLISPLHWHGVVVCQSSSSLVPWAAACPSAAECGRRDPARSPPDKIPLVVSEIPPPCEPKHSKRDWAETLLRRVVLTCAETLTDPHSSLLFSLYGTQYVNLDRPERAFRKRMFKTRLILALTNSFESKRAQKNIHDGISPFPSYKFPSK